MALNSLKAAIYSFFCMRDLNCSRLIWLIYVRLNHGSILIVDYEVVFMATLIVDKDCVCPKKFGFLL